MPIANAKDGCPINYRGRRPGRRAGADAVQLARHQPAHVGRPGAGLVASISAWCATTGAATASPARRRAPTPWTCSAATRSRSPTPPAPRSSTGAACRWAAWSGNGSAPTRRDRVEQARPLQHALLLRRQAALARPHQVRAGQRPGEARPARRWSAGSPRTSATRSPQAGRQGGRDVHRDQARRLPRLLRGGARHGLPRLDADHHRADPGHRRQPRTRRRCRSTARRSTR